MNKISRKLICYILGVMFFFSCSVFAGFYGILKNQMMEHHVTELQDKVTSVRDRMEESFNNENEQTMCVCLKYLDEITLTEVYIVRADGEPFICQMCDGCEKTVPQDVQRFGQKVMKSDIGRNTVIEKKDGCLTAGALIEEGGKVSSAVVIEENVKFDKENMVLPLAVLGGCLLFAMVLAAIAAVCLVKRFMRPIREIAEVTGQLADGNYQVKIQRFDDDEVAGKLDPTGTSYDICAFMDFETAYMLFESEQIKYVSDVSDPREVVSLLMIRGKEDADPKEIAKVINYQMDTPLQAFTPASIFDQVSGTLNQMQSYSVLLIVLLFAMAVLALICIFNITIGERKREFGIMMSVGTRKSKIFRMLILEAGIIGIIGGVLGIVVAGGGIFLFQEQITMKMNMPYLISGVGEYAQIAVRCILLSVVTSILSTLYAAVKLTRMEPFQLIQEVDR